VSRKAIWLVGFFVTTALIGVGYLLRPINGKVLEVGTDRPVADAYVALMLTGMPTFVLGMALARALTYG